MRQEGYFEATGTQRGEPGPQVEQKTVPGDGRPWPSHFQGDRCGAGGRSPRYLACFSNKDAAHALPAPPSVAAGGHSWFLQCFWSQEEEGIPQGA